jgi:hypothetical protein
MKAKNLNLMLTYLEQNHPECQDKSIEAEHDMIYIPTPDLITNELKEKAEELGFLFEGDDMYCFC